MISICIIKHKGTSSHNKICGSMNASNIIIYSFLRFYSLVKNKLLHRHRAISAVLRFGHPSRGLRLIHAHLASHTNRADDPLPTLSMMVPVCAMRHWAPPRRQSPPATIQCHLHVPELCRDSMVLPDLSISAGELSSSLSPTSPFGRRAPLWTAYFGELTPLQLLKMESSPLRLPPQPVLPTTKFECRRCPSTMAQGSPVFNLHPSPASDLGQLVVAWSE
jgi:hypothetical protein